MEDKKGSESESAGAGSLFPLNFDCMHEIFKLLRIADCMSLAEAYDGMQSIADFMFKTKFNYISINLNKNIDINRIMYHIGPFVQSLRLQPCEETQITEEQMFKTVENCKEIIQLTLYSFDQSQFKNNPFCNTTVKLETLNLQRCGLADDDDFFNGFTNLKYLRIQNCWDISKVALKKCFQNNQGITCFIYVQDARKNPNPMYEELIPLLPNLDKLVLQQNSRLIDLKFLSKIKTLRSLSVHCTDKNINSLLSELATEIDLEDLELINVYVDRNTFKIINSFRKLRRLSILIDYGNMFMFTSSIKLPTKLNTLCLGRFDISHRQILSLIEDRKHLKYIRIWHCYIITEGAEDSSIRQLEPDFTSVTRQIFEKKCKSDKSREVVLYFGGCRYGANGNSAVIDSFGKTLNYRELTSAFEFFRSDDGLPYYVLGD